MNERDELLEKFNTAMPLVNELNSLENKSAKCTKTNKKLIKAIVVLAFFVIGCTMLTIGVGAASDDSFMFFIQGAFPLWVILGIMIWCFIANKKKLKTTDETIAKIANSDELSFIPFSYRNSVNMVGIYMVLVDMRAYSLTDAINIWEQDLHNRIMEAKPSVIV